MIVVKLYLKDDWDAGGGIREASVVGWTGKAVAFPRNRFGELGEHIDVEKPGVYFLFGVNEFGEQMAYVGTGQNVWESLREEHEKREFWEEAVVFTIEDYTVSPAHSQCLRAMLVMRATGAKRYRIENTNADEKLAPIPDQEFELINDVIEFIRILLGVLGQRVLEPHYYSLSGGKPGLPVRRGVEISMCEAKGLLTVEGVVVLKDSKALLPVVPRLEKVGYDILRERLKADGVLVVKGNELIFSRDYLFSSAKVASGIVCGTSIAGRKGWRTIDGKDLNEIETMVRKYQGWSEKT
jgi:hypothetical protein